MPSHSLQSREAAPLGLGWSCGAYSNPETFSKAAAEQFVSACNRIGMSVSFLYPGNAKNEMVEDKDDSSLETANVVAMYGHGSTAGPDLEYKPLYSPLGYWDYKWGDRGIARWIFVGGCDALGFPVFNDNNQQAPGVYPYLNRYSDAFAGISGICGFRSASWYIPGFQAFSPINDFGEVDLLKVGGGYGAELANRLNALNTFYDSWVGAAHWLHARLGRGAETAVFANTADNLTEHLKAYRSDRRIGFDPASVRTTRVGSGAPTYDYCHVIDRATPPNCVSGTTFTGFLPLNARAEDHPPLSGGIFPIFRWSVSKDDIAFVNSAGKLFGFDNLLDIYASGGSISVNRNGDSVVANESGELMITSMRGAPIDAQQLVAAIAAETTTQMKLKQLAPKDGEYSVGATRFERILSIDQDIFPIRLDSGVTLNGATRGVRFEGSIWSLGRITGERRLPSIADCLAYLSMSFTERDASDVHVRLEKVYVKTGGTSSGTLVPSVQANVIGKAAGKALDTMCLFL